MKSIKKKHKIYTESLKSFQKLIFGNNFFSIFSKNIALPHWYPCWSTRQVPVVPCLFRPSLRRDLPGRRSIAHPAYVSSRDGGDGRIFGIIWRKGKWLKMRNWVLGISKKKLIDKKIKQFKFLSLSLSLKNTNFKKLTWS